MQPLKTMLLALLLPSLVLMAMATTTETDINETWNVESAQGDGDWMGGGEYFDEEEEEEEASDGSRLAWMSFRLDDMEERLRSLGADVGRNEEYLIQVLRMQVSMVHRMWQSLLHKEVFLVFIPADAFAVSCCCCWCCWYILLPTVDAIVRAAAVAVVVLVIAVDAFTVIADDAFVPILKAFGLLLRSFLKVIGCARVGLATTTTPRAAPP